MLKMLRFLGVLGVLATPALAQQPIKAKKLIEYGWDVPLPDYVRAHIREMEQKPFDGLIFRLPGGTGIFTKTKWDETKFAATFEDCRNIRWDKFTDNFLIMLAASDMDWFSDADWEAVHQHIGIVAKAAALARCRGICFDQEPYGFNPWHYPNQVQAKTKSFTEYEAKVRQRGAEFIRIVTQHLPKAVIHTFFQLSYFSPLMDEPDLVRRSQRLSQEGYSLLPAFLNGMLDAAGPDVLITDGNESSYYYTDPLAYFQVYHTVRQRALTLVAPENTRKYQTQVQMSQALYVDYLFGLGVWAERRSPAPALTPAERARWFEHNTYYALKTADEFVWLYSEKMNWWTNKDVPAGLEPAVAAARAKIAKRQPLGFEIATTLKAAQDRRQAELRAKLVTRTAAIQALPAGVAAPVIDGDLSDPAWQATPALAPFLPYVGSKGKPPAATEARVTYDTANLYIAVRCAEPKPEAMHVTGALRDDSVWEGDSVDVFIAPGAGPVPYVHLILNPANVHWDALFTEQNALDFNPAWTSATHVGTADWTAELAIPWAELTMKPPAPGETHRANLCRQRRLDGEQTSWSQMMSGFLEHDNFGTWTFR